MPPSSRKRNKGKERKAKQLAKKEETDRAAWRRFWIGWATKTTCNHGYEIVIPADEHPVSSFMDQFYINLLHKGMTVSANLNDTFETHAQIWNNESYRELAIGIMIRIGSNLLLTGDKSVEHALCVAQSIVLLEHYNGTAAGDIDSVINKRMVAPKIRDLHVGNSSSRRDALKFYRKRISCKCLKKMHLEARKTMPKTGKCEHCKQEKERVSLSICSRCMIDQYCSRECQVAHWPVHKTYCDHYFEQSYDNE